MEIHGSNEIQADQSTQGDHEEPALTPAHPEQLEPSSVEQASSSLPPWRQWKTIFVGAIALGLGLAIGLPRMQFWNETARANDTTENTADSNKTVLTVATIQLEPESSYELTRTYTGEVASLRASDLGFEHSGTLEWVGVNRGDRVPQGTPIARLDTRNLAAQRSQLVAQRNQAIAVLTELQRGARQEDIDAAQATVRDLEDQLALQRIRQTRREYLAEEGAISREQLDEVAFGADALEDRLDAARSQLQELLTGTRPEQIAAQDAVVEQLTAQIADLDITIDKSTITAPFDGVIGDRQQDEGTVVSAGQAVVRLVESAQPEVEIGIPSNTVQTLPPGSSQFVEVGGDRYSATVQSILPELDPATRTRTVVLQLAGVDSNIVAPGQIARLHLQESIPDPGYWLPTTALVQGEKGLWNAYAVIPDHSTSTSSTASTSASFPSSSSSYRVERRIVDVLHTEGDRVFVQGTLAPGDVLIANGVQRVVPGQQIQPDTIQTITN